MKGYRGRLAPSPTGYLHVGHGRTFWVAWVRARRVGGALVLRNEDLDRARCREEFVGAMMDDLRWLGLDWDEGPEVGGAHGPYEQSRRQAWYEEAFERLRSEGLVYPCACSRRDIMSAASAPHRADEEPVYPGTCRARGGSLGGAGGPWPWRFRVPDGEEVRFVDGICGEQALVAGQDFGDFVVWRREGMASYQLAVVVDDAAMGVTEVVRGEDLLVSTARQILLYRALGWKPPAYAHAPLVTDARGVRLAKRDAALSLRELRRQGVSAEALRASWEAEFSTEAGAHFRAVRGGGGG